MLIVKSSAAVGAAGEQDFLINSSLRQGDTPISLDERPIVLIEKQRLLRESLSTYIGMGIRQAVKSFSSADRWVKASDRVAPSAILLSTIGISDRDAIDATLQKFDLAKNNAPLLILSDDDGFTRGGNTHKTRVAAIISTNDSWPAILRALQAALQRSKRHAKEMPAGDSDGAPTKALAQSRLRYLTARELNIIEALLEGKTNKKIANDLQITESTVKVHLYNIMRKYQVKNRTELAIRLGRLSEFTSGH